MRHRKRTTALLIAAALALTAAAWQKAVPQRRIQIRQGAGGALIMQKMQQPGRAIIQLNAQRPPQAESDPRPEGALFVPNRQMTRALNEAEKMFERRQYTEGITLLQKFILDVPEDFPFYPDSETRTHFRSHKTEALRLLGRLPPEGLQVYEDEYGPTVRYRLDQARAAGNGGWGVAAMEELARRFFHTQAGAEAAYRLGTWHLDHGNALQAGLYFDRLRTWSPHAAQWEPALSLKTALSWERAGRPEESMRALLALRARAGGESLTLGGEPVRLFRDADDARSWLVRLMGRPPEALTPETEQWTLFRGNPQRTGSSGPVSPLPRVGWAVETLFDEHAPHPARQAILREQFRQLEKRYSSDNELTLPAMHPLIVGDKVVFRTYRNIRAVDRDTGDLLWETVHSDPTFDREMEETGGQLTGDPDENPLARLLMQRAWNDLAAGTLSSDGRVVYALEDLDYVHHVNQPTRVLESALMQRHNKLMAYDLASGKLLWEIGGAPDGSGLPLAGTFFLGPPLPLEGLLYVLAEANHEIRLLALAVEPVSAAGDGPAAQYNVSVEWSQPLLQPQGSVQHSPRRRVAGLSPSFHSGILVCPTTAGAVVALDLTRQLLLWGYVYRTKEQNASAAGRQPRFGGGVGPGFATGSYLLPFSMTEDRWIDSAVTLADGKAILTPADSDEIHCLNLLEGTRLWTKPRGRGLYVACVHEGSHPPRVIVVSRTEVTALNLDDGEPAWSEPLPIPMPSGRGLKTEHLYRLGLSTGEIATIDLNTGRLIARSPTPEGRLPGNLVAGGVVMVSQTTDEIVGYKSRDQLQESIQTRLNADPADPQALALRGEMKLHAGDEQAGIDDLLQSVTGEPNERNQAILVGTLLEGLRHDFAGYKEATHKIRHLITDPRQQSLFLRRYADGLQSTGNHRAAFSEYLKLAGSGTTSGGVGGVAPELETVNSLWSVRSDRRLQPRLLEIYTAASPEERAEMDREIEAQLQLAAGASPAGRSGPERLRTFRQALSGFPAAESAGRRLAELLNPTADAIELEFLLLQLRESPDPPTAGWATARMVRLLAALDHHGEALPLLRELETRFAGIDCLDGKTGAELAAAWRAEAPFAAALAGKQPWPERKIEAIYAALPSRTPRRTPVLRKGTDETGLQRSRFQLEHRNPVRLRGVDPSGRELWSLQLPNRAISFPASSVRLRGHLLAVDTGNAFTVIDTLRPPGAARLLFSGNLFDSESMGSAGQMKSISIVHANGRVVRRFADRYGRPFGEVSAITAGHLCYQAGETLYAADPLTGEILWKRHGFPHGCKLHTTDDIVVVKPRGADEAVLLRAVDGREINRITLPPVNQRLRMTAQRLVLWDQSNPRPGQLQPLSILDLSGGETIFRAEFPVNTSVNIIDDEEIALLQPDGAFTILRLDDGKNLLEAQVRPVDPQTQVAVHRSAHRYLLITSRPDPRNTVHTQGPGVADVPAGGPVYAFDRATGRRLWATTVGDQIFSRTQPADAPLLIFAARNFLPRGFRSRGNHFDLLILDARNGRRIFDGRISESLVPWQLRTGADDKTLDIIFSRSKLSLAPSEKPLEPPAALEDSAAEEK